MSHDAQVVIVGGGLTGACMANLLVKAGVEAQRVWLIEPRFNMGPAAPDIDLRVSAVSRATERILRHCEVWPSLPEERQAAYERMCVWDEKGQAQGRGSIEFDCAQIGQPNLGYIVENAAMQSALLQRARDRGVHLCSGQVDSLERHEESMRVGLKDGTSLQAQLVVAADGANSSTRSLMGLAVREAAYGQQAVVTHIRTSKPHRRTAWQRFLSSGPIALLPLREERRCSIVWSTTEDSARDLMAMEEAQFCCAVEGAIDGVVGQVESCVRRAVFPLRRLHAEDYVALRFALVGDAAHVIHPLAGQGVNLGFMDAAVLAEVIGSALQRSADPGDLSVLRRYERWRKGDNLLMLAALDGLNRLFSNDHAALGLLRRTGLSLAGQVGPLKNRFMRHALGLAGELPAAAAQ